MSQTTVDVATPRGTMPTYVHRPDGTGPSPRVLLYMDAPGIRPALLGYAERLADAGYTAIVPDLYYPFDPAEKFDAERLAAGEEWACIGFCMGGRLGMRAAEAFGTEIAAASLLHPTGLVTDAPDSPHLEVDRVDAG